jgi:NAD+ kinase
MSPPSDSTKQLDTVGGPSIRLVGFVVHTGRDHAVDAATSLSAWLADRGIVTRSAEGTDMKADEIVPNERFPDGLDLVISVGGDGTFLRAAHMAVLADCPVLGVNMGRMGFLTEVGEEGAIEMLQQVVDGGGVIEERMAVVARGEGTRWTEERWALNEVMVEKRARHRVVRLMVMLDDEYVTTFSGDGVIVATPTGSTGYSFSARGPIVSPSVNCLVVTPVAAHMVFDRAFVIGADERVTIEVTGDEEGLFSADGQEALEIPVGARIHVRAADRPARLVRGHQETFYRRVRTRFQLPGMGPDVTPPL